MIMTALESIERGIHDARNDGFTPTRILLGYRLYGCVLREVLPHAVPPVALADPPRLTTLLDLPVEMSDRVHPDGFNVMAEPR